MRCFSNYASNGLIEIQNGSQLLLKNSAFTGFGHFVFSSAILFAEPNDSVHISNCTLLVLQQQHNSDY